MSSKVGFIGMGIMGRPMARNILGAGTDLMVYNRTAEKTRSLEEAGAKVAATLDEIARWSDIVVLMLTGPEAIDAVVFEENGLLAAGFSGKTLINMSTVSPAYARSLNVRLEPHAIACVDAPVSGSRKPAEDAALVILCGGPEKLVAQLEPLLLRMGKKVVYCGPAGQGSCMKMAVNLLLGIMMTGLGEAVNLGQKSGLALETIFETVLSGPLNCGLFNLKAEMFKSGEFPAQFPLKHMTKDIRFVLQTADECGAAAPVGHAVFQLFRQAVGLQLGDMDFAAVKKVIEAVSDRGKI